MKPQCSMQTYHPHNQQHKIRTREHWIQRMTFAAASWHCGEQSADTDVALGCAVTHRNRDRHWRPPNLLCSLSDAAKVTDLLMRSTVCHYYTFLYTTEMLLYKNLISDRFYATLHKSSAQTRLAWLPPMPWHVSSPTFSPALRPMLSRHCCVSLLRIWKSQ